MLTVKAINLVIGHEAEPECVAIGVYVKETEIFRQIEMHDAFKARVREPSLSNRVALGEIRHKVGNRSTQFRIPALFAQGLEVIPEADRGFNLGDLSVHLLPWRRPRRSGVREKG